uniref:Uncharacterized protein n=1 Tax=viral metagenome TaxID=1070528 RepID=A0A6M3LRC6_9ZZZZ
MRTYLDVQPVSTNPDEGLPLSRYDITGFTPEEEEAEIKDIAILMEKQKYMVSRHLCGHEERKPCTMQIIKEVK